MKHRIRNFVVVVAALACWGLAAAGQVTAGENTTLNMSGDLSVGYSGSYGDTVESAHGITFGGNGRLHGSYYDPKFLNFDIHPFYNRSQTNSTSQSISDSSGVDATLNLFSGSRFPGSFSYGRAFDTSGQFGVPGITGFTSHGNGQTFGVSWSALLPKLPTLTVNYTRSASDSEIYGASANSANTVHNFNVQSSYQLDGFHILGGYYRQSNDASFPSLFDGQAGSTSATTNNQYVIQTSHALPKQGDWFIHYTRSNFSGEFRTDDTQKGSNSGTVDVVTTGVTVRPADKLSLSLVTTYNGNVFGGLQEQILQLGGNPFISTTAASSKALTIDGSAFYKLTRHIDVNGDVIRLNQYFPDHDLGVTRYGGSVNFNYAFRWLGSLSFSIGAVDTATQEGNSGASLVSNVNFARRFGPWDATGTFSYMQQVETLLVNYTTSSFLYNAGLRRRFMNGLQWSGMFHGSHSGFTRQAGSANQAEGVTSTFNYSHYGVTGTYSRSSGVSILTPQGLVTLPNVPPELLSQRTLYNAESYGVGGSFALRRASFSFTYSRATSDTAGTTSSWFDTTLMNARLRWRLRKLNLDGGYTKLDQGYVTSRGFTPNVINTFYIGVSRWFNVF